MDRTRAVFVAILVGAMVFIGLGSLYALWPSGASDMGDEPGIPVGQVEESGSSVAIPDVHDSEVVVLDFASSSTKKNWLDQMVADFNEAGVETASGKRVMVVVSHVSSGGSKDAILGGNIEPAAWSPGSRSWVTQINETWDLRYNEPIASESCMDTIYTPLGIAMWQPMAEVLGWPDAPITWQTLIDLAADPTGWERYGRPEWGDFRFGHSHPQYSNAGMLTMTSLVYGITGETAGLTAADVYAPEVEAALQDIEQNTSKYGRITTDLLSLMALEGPTYLHAVATFESDTVESNLTMGDSLQFPLAFIFPAGGAFWGSHPYCILDNADWVTPEMAEAATLFRDYMLAPEQQALAADYLLRPLVGSPTEDSLLRLENGTDPRVTTETVPPLGDPDGAVGAAVIDLFLLTKRKATMMVVLDTSGSMEGTKMSTATEATVNFLNRLDPNDEIGVILFSSQVTTLAEPARVGDVVESLGARVGASIAEGNTALYEAVCEATRIIEGLQAADEAAGETRLYGIVVLSDGEDTVGNVSENQMFATCLPNNAEADGIKIFPIGLGDDVNETALSRMARVTGGKYFAATPETIEAIYFSISAEQ